jgi:hypothetical protein
MAKPSRERVRKWREKKTEKGGRSLSTWLEPETARMMDFLLDHYGESAAPLIARAISTLYCVTRDRSEPVSGVASNAPAVVAQARTGRSSVAACSSADALPTGPLPAAEAAVVEETAVDAELHPLLQEIKTKLSAGVPFKELQKTLLVQWIKSMQAEEVSFREMTELLNAAAIPTPTGMGRWEQGMIPTVLLLSSF